MDGWDGWDLSQTTTTIRAPLAVLIIEPIILWRPFTFFDKGLRLKNKTPKLKQKVYVYMMMLVNTTREDGHIFGTVI